MLAEAATVAAMHWPKSPCRGREQVEIVSLAQMHQASGSTRAWGHAIPSRCTVLVAPARMPRARQRHVCRLLVHEFGHLAGQSHARSPYSVMYPTVFDIRADTPRCWTLKDQAARTRNRKASA